jgi:signal transduction histidine kinase
VTAATAALRHALTPPRVGGWPRTSHVAWSVAATACGLALASRLLLAFDPYTLLPRPGPPVWLGVTGQVAGPLIGVVVISTLGAVAAGRQRVNRLGLALLGTALAVGLTLFCQEYAVLGLVSAPGSLPGAVQAAWLQAWLYDVLLFGVLLGLLLFPDGRLPSRRWFALVGVAGVVTALSLLDSLANPGLLGTSVRDQTYSLPVTMPPALWGVGSDFASWSGVPVYWLQALLIPAASGAVLLRLRSAGGEQRRQIKWVAFAGALTAIPWLLSYLDGLPPEARPNGSLFQTLDAWGDLGWVLGLTVVIPLAAGAAVLRYRLYEIDKVINRAILVGGLAAFITGVYVAVVIGAGSAVGSGLGPALSLVAAAIAAVGFAPVRARLQTLANRLVYGHRATPYEVLADFAERLSGAYADEDALALMARLVGEGMGAERSEVWLRVASSIRLAASWPAGGRSATLPLVAEELPAALAGERVLAVRDQGELLGALRVSLRSGERLAPQEDKLLEDLARQAALILRSVRLIAELRSSRTRVVQALDEERRRLERDLHDGAQQRLVTAAMALGMAREELEQGQVPRTRRSLTEASAELSRGLADLRDLARGLHPAVLTESGLAAAIESLVERSTLEVLLELAIPPDLPAPVQTSAYFYVSEALANVARHARASVVRIRASEIDDRLRIEVIDDGIGGANPELGSGLRGLSDRLTAVGGTLRMESPRGAGTRLVGELPCA